MPKLDIGTIAGIVFAETRDMVEGQPPGAPPLAALRANLATLIGRSGDGSGFARPEQPTIVDLGDPAIFAAWNDCVAAATAPTNLDPNYNAVFFSSSDPTTENGLIQTHPWLKTAKPVAAGTAMRGPQAETLWILQADVLPAGRFPRTAKTSLPSPSRFASPFAGKRWRGGLLFVLGVALLVGAGLSIDAEAYRSRKPYIGACLDKLETAKSALRDALSQDASKAPQRFTETIEKARQEVNRARSDAFDPRTVASSDPAQACPHPNVPQDPSDQATFASGKSILWSWALSTLAIVAILALASFGLRGEILGFLVDERGRMSLSRLQFVAWSVLILGAYWTASAWNLGASAPQSGPVLPAMSQDLWILLGIVTASPLVSSLVLGVKSAGDGAPADLQGASAGQSMPSTNTGPIEVRGPGEWSFLDLFVGEEVTNNNSIEISRLQQFIFTLVTLLAFVLLCQSLFSSLDPGIRIIELPPLDTTLVGLLALSHAAYLTAKTLPKTGTANAPK